MNIDKTENQSLIDALNTISEEAIRYIGMGKDLDDFRNEFILVALEREMDISASRTRRRWFVKKQIVDVSATS